MGVVATVGISVERAAVPVGPCVSAERAGWSCRPGAKARAPRPPRSRAGWFREQPATGTPTIRGELRCARKLWGCWTTNLAARADPRRCGPARSPTLRGRARVASAADLGSTSLAVERVCASSPCSSAAVPRRPGDGPQPRVQRLGHRATARFMDARRRSSSASSRAFPTRRHSPISTSGASWHRSTRAFMTPRWPLARQGCIP